MNMKEKVLGISKVARELDRNSPSIKLPQNAYYMNENDIVCFEREKGASRYPYEHDGFTIWAHSTGNIEAFESDFDIFKTVLFNTDPTVCFFTGIPNGKGEFHPISVLGIGRQLYESAQVERYVVYSPRCAYYIAETKDLISALRVHTDEKKHIHFSYITINKSEDIMELYMANYLEPWIGYWSDGYNPFVRSGRYENHSYFITHASHCFVANMRLSGAKVTSEYHTSGRKRFLGGADRQLLNAVPLRTGVILQQATNVRQDDNMVCADIFHTELGSGEYMEITYDISYYHDLENGEKEFGSAVNMELIETDLQQQEIEELSKFNMNIRFEDWKLGVNVHVLNRFLRNVQKQVSVCALGKNYAGSMNGIRDIMQQIETCLIWQPEECRKKLIIALNYILEDGRPPRQFAVPPTENALPSMDLRMFIDQGNWIISTMYTYLAYTKDYSILDEICGYYVAVDRVGEWPGIVAKCEQKDSVLCHLIRIMDYLVSNLDQGGTECLKVLYGDWNDALNGLGRTKDQDKEYGTGVSVMASLHFYQNCREICEILSVVGGYEKKIAQYTECQRRIKEGLFKHAVDINDEGSKRIVHGWGDKLAYKVGTHKDSDGASRTSSTVHSFWALSGMLLNDVSYKEVLLEAFERLDSKYGFKTFDKCFPTSMEPYVGRIVHLIPGTYENAASYVHSATFAIMALFLMGESEWAWEQIEKAMVISHENCTLTPFVMPNSYCYNEEYSIDGDSMGDWHTGSGTVLLKGLIKYGFGIVPDLHGVTIQTARTLPCNAASIELAIREHRLLLKYNNRYNGERKIYVNGQVADAEYDSLMQTYKLYLTDEQLCADMTIEVID